MAPGLGFLICKQGQLCVCPAEAPGRSEPIRNLPLQVALQCEARTAVKA